MINYKKLANDLLDHFIDVDGVIETIIALIHYGYKDNELLEIGFEEEEIDIAKEELL